MYEYYEQQSVLPTFANLTDETAVGVYQRQRETVFTQRLLLPPRLFRGAELLEFGPDSGENALVFARWGATVTAVEPNPNAHGPLRAYFDGYAPPGSLRTIDAADVLRFRSEQLFDIVVAEGFIYTVSPTTAWLDAFARVTASGGLAIVSYYERHGALIELALKALYHLAKRATSEAGIAIATRLYGAKWDAIPHTRAFASWVMDVLENPFVRLATFLDASTLVALAYDAGFDLFSAWPSYRDPFDVSWHKAPVDLPRKLAATREHLMRSALGFIIGANGYAIGPRTEAQWLASSADALLAAIDGTIDSATTDTDAVVTALEEIEARVRTASIFGETAKPTAQALFASLRRAFAVAGSGDVDELARFTSEDSAFIAHWGLPAHFSVFRRLAQA